MLLKKPICVGGLTLNNRLVLPPMYTARSSPDGLVRPELCEYYHQRARGGHIGLIITEHSFVSQQGKAGPNQMSVAADTVVPGLCRLAEAIRVDGTKAFVQISHAGSLTTSEITGQRLVSASKMGNPGRKAIAELPRPLTVKEIHQIRDQFVRAAERVKAAGFDGVEIHCAHGYLLNEFFSPITNRRVDEYGGNLKNRLRLLIEIIRGIKDSLGSCYPVAVRLGGADYLEGGNTFEDAVEACRTLESEGVCLLDLSGGLCRYIRRGHSEPGYFAEMSSAVMGKVSVPVMLTGGVTSPQQAEALLQAGAADMIGVARAIMQNARWAESAMNDEIE